MITFLLDSDACIGENENTVSGVYFSITKVDSINDSGSIIKKVLHRLASDAGGGGTREGLAVELDKRESLCDSL